MLDVRDGGTGGWGWGSPVRFNHQHPLTACLAACQLSVPVPALLLPLVQSTNRDVYNGTVRDLLGGVLQGINTTVFGELRPGLCGGGCVQYWDVSGA